MNSEVVHSNTNYDHLLFLDPSVLKREDSEDRIVASRFLIPKLRIFLEARRGKILVLGFWRLCSFRADYFCSVMVQFYLKLKAKTGSHPQIVKTYPQFNSFGPAKCSFNHNRRNSKRRQLPLFTPNPFSRYNQKHRENMRYLKGVEHLQIVS
ncbi:unnamed protein product [Lactuca virosa]|uniref:Uncharacterized protein n=1 Tax=Lactuca virosa TaxID=75947 RepID=A0AAU9NI05_9ASTR|nr:unnamed protein product [Lactuca virosa]